MWRPIVAGIATLHEIETAWSLDDLLVSNLMLTYQARLEQAAAEPSR